MPRDLIVFPDRVDVLDLAESDSTIAPDGAYILSEAGLKSLAGHDARPHSFSEYDAIIFLKGEKIYAADENGDIIDSAAVGTDEQIINSVLANYDKVHIRHGNYHIAGSIIISRNFTNLTGDGDDTIINVSGESSGLITDGRKQRIILKNFQLVGNPTAANGLDLTIWNSIVRNVKCYYFVNGIQLNHPGISTDDNLLEWCRCCLNSGVGIYANSPLTNIVFPICGENGSHQIYLKEDGNYLTGATLWGAPSGRAHIYLDRANQCSILGNRIASNNGSAGGIRIEASRGNIYAVNVANNKITDVSGAQKILYGIYVSAHNGFTASGIHVHDNLLHFAGTAVNNFGIKFASDTGGSITDCLCTNNLLSGNFSEKIIQ